MIYLILSAVSVVLLFGAICTCFKLGENDGICQYDPTDLERGETDCL